MFELELELLLWDNGSLYSAGMSVVGFYIKFINLSDHTIPQHYICQDS